MGFQRGENFFGHAAAHEDQAVGVGENRALDRAPHIGDLPIGDRFDLRLSETNVARGFAVLREHELRAAGPAGADLAELAQLCGNLALWAAVELKAFGRVFECVGDERENRPPIAGRAGRRAGSFTGSRSPNRTW